MSRLGVAAALERVLDQTGDVLFVFDDENAMSHHPSRRVLAKSVASVSAMLIVG